MMQSFRRNTLTWALWANALIFGAWLILSLTRGTSSLSNARASERAEQAPIAGGGGVFIMPGQLSTNSWGCYLLDIDHQTLATYRYTPGDKKLLLEAARNYRYDLQLKNLNTFPAPTEIQHLVEDQKAPPNRNDALPPAPVPTDGKAVPPGE